MSHPPTGRMPAYAGLEVEERQDGPHTILRLSGELDLRTTPKLRGQLADILRRQKGDLVVDLCAVEFIDSTGLAALLNALRRLTRADRGLALVCADGAVLRVLRLTRLDTTFRVFDTLEDAMAATRRPPAAVA